MMFASVIIPTNKPLRQLETTLRSLRELPEQDFETLIVRNGIAAASTAGEEVVCQSELPGSRVIYEENAGLLAGRHRGVAESRFGILIFIDDDVRVAPGWLEAIRRCFADPDVQMVGGPGLPEFEVPPPDWLSSFWTTEGDNRWCISLSLLDYGSEACAIDPRYIWGLNFSIRRSSLKSLGGFHPDGVPWHMRKFRGDGETAVAMQLISAGGLAMYHPEAAVTHLIPRQRLTLRYFRRRAFLQGVSDSYTRIRKLGAIPDRHEPAPRSDFTSFVKKSLRSVLNRNPLSKQYQRYCADLAYQNGIRFHEYEVGRDSQLLQWVLRDNYWDYAYPASMNLGD